MSHRRLIELTGITLVIVSIGSFRCGKDEVLSPVEGETQLIDFSYSDCQHKILSRDPIHTMSDSAEVEIYIDGLQITVVHTNAEFNCCIDSIGVNFDQENTLLKLTENDFYTSLCLCNCLYEVQATIEVSSPGTYVIEIWANDRLIWSGEVVVEGK